MANRNFAIPYHTVAWVVFLAIVATNVVASLELRGLYADGAFYLLNMIQEEGFWLFEPSRRTVQFLQQLPSVMAIVYGIHDVGTLAVVYSLTMQLLPLAFVAACYIVLPEDRKEWFFFPLLHYLAGSTGAEFPSIVEGPVATSYFWLVLYLILFRTEKRSSLALTALISLPAIYAHEVMIFLAPILALSSVWRSFEVESRLQRAGLRLLVLWFAFVAAVQIGFVLHPARGTSGRSSFLHDFMELNWLVTAYGDTNVPVVLGMLSIMSMLLVWAISLIGRESSWVKDSSLLVTAIFGLFCLMAVVATLYFNRFFCPSMQFAARNHPAFVSVPLAVLALASLRWPRLQAVWDTVPNRMILLFLAMGTLGWNIVATAYWADFVTTYRDQLARHQGLVRYEDVVMSLPQDQRNRFDKMIWSWTNPTLSILLSPRGKVSTLISIPSKYAAGWQPFDPAYPDSLPKCDWFDTSNYRRVIEQGVNPTNAPTGEN
jgi:hypothetical protein